MMSRRTKVSLTQHYRRTKWFDTKLNMINTYPKGRSSRSRYILLSPILWACSAASLSFLETFHRRGNCIVEMSVCSTLRLRMNGLFSHQTWLVFFSPYPSEKYEFVSWDDENSHYMESHKIPWFQSPPTRNIFHS